MERRSGTARVVLGLKLPWERVGGLGRVARWRMFYEDSAILS